jgi:hypothetical protein
MPSMGKLPTSAMHDTLEEREDVPENEWDAT